MEFFFQQLRDWIWSPPLFLLLACTGLWYTLALRGIQFRGFAEGVRLIFSSSDEEHKGDISQFQALMTALAGAIGTGSIAGVATAVTVGGFGAIFWMWIIAFLGMATSYAEAVLALRFRSKDENGAIAGGPMYAISRGLGWPGLGSLFACFAVLASFGIGSTVQANSVADAVKTMTGISPFWTGLALMALTFCVVVGGVKTVGKLAGLLVPFMAVFYVGAGLVVLLMHFWQIPEAFMAIVNAGLSGQAAVGGFAGSSVTLALQMGLSRGIFSNESGLGSTAIAAASAQTSRPASQGLMAMMGTFFATMVVCTITGLVLYVGGGLGRVTAEGLPLSGASLAIAIFRENLPFGAPLVMTGLILFAYSTAVAWAYYGERCSLYLFGPTGAKIFRVVYSLSVLPGAVLSLEAVWAFADAMNGLMAIPNLIGLLALTPVVLRESGFLRERVA